MPTSRHTHTLFTVTPRGLGARKRIDPCNRVSTRRTRCCKIPRTRITALPDTALFSDFKLAGLVVTPRGLVVTLLVGLNNAIATCRLLLGRNFHHELFLDAGSPLIVEPTAHLPDAHGVKFDFVIDERVGIVHDASDLVLCAPPITPGMLRPKVVSQFMDHSPPDSRPARVSVHACRRIVARTDVPFGFS